MPYLFSVQGRGIYGRNRTAKYLCKEFIEQDSNVITDEIRKLAQETLASQKPKSGTYYINVNECETSNYDGILIRTVTVRSSGGELIQ